MTTSTESRLPLAIDLEFYDLEDGVLYELPLKIKRVVDYKSILVRRVGTVLHSTPMYEDSKGYIMVGGIEGMKFQGLLDVTTLESVPTLANTNLTNLSFLAIMHPMYKNLGYKTFNRLFVHTAKTKIFPKSMHDNSRVLIKDMKVNETLSCASSGVQNLDYSYSITKLSEEEYSFKLNPLSTAKRFITPSGKMTISALIDVLIKQLEKGALGYEFPKFINNPLGAPLEGVTLEDIMTVYSLAVHTDTVRGVYN